jgi:hypothetical protein
LKPEGTVQFQAPQSVTGGEPLPDRPGYNYDACNAKALMTRMSVKNGRLMLPDGMSYRLLVLPDSPVMTPALLSKIVELVKDGATVVGPKPQKSPSLSGYPDADAALAKMADELWGDCDGQKVTEHAFGSGKVIWGPAPEKVLADCGVPEDFQVDGGMRGALRYIHRQMNDGTDIYFVTNKYGQSVNTTCTFRVAGKQPELWWPQSGKIVPVATFEEKDGVTRLPLQLEGTESVFVIFHPGQKTTDPVVSITRDGQESVPMTTRIVLQKATYGVANDPSRTRDVTAKVQTLIDEGTLDFTVSTLAAGDDPAPQVTKTLEVNYTTGGVAKIFVGQDKDTIHLEPAEVERGPELRVTADGQWQLEVWKKGHYVLTTALGKIVNCDATKVLDQQNITGPWELNFPPGTGAPNKVTLDQLVSWSNNADSGVKYFSGTAIYRKMFTFNSEVDFAKTRVDLDLGNVQVIAELKVNGKDMGILWKSPYQTEITDALKPGENTLEIKVTNLWINRMIGDEQLPEDSERNSNGTLKVWPQWLHEGKSSPTGRYTFTTWRLWNKDSPLQDSGLIGPVRLKYATRLTLQQP